MTKRREAKADGVRVLILEDTGTDAVMTERSLRQSLPDCSTLVVGNKSDYQRALKEFAPNLILSDHRLPGFTGADALRMAQELCPGTPFILVTGSVGEETAVEYMKAGAVDYLLKDRAARLGPAALAALQRREEQEERERALGDYREIFYGAPVGICRWAADGRILAANPALARMLGYEDAEAFPSINIMTEVYVNADDVTWLAAATDRDQAAEAEASWKRRDGKKIWVQVSVRSVTGAGERCFEAFVRDVSEQKRLADQLRQAQRMEAVGQLAGGIAHDFNNILTAILGYADLLLLDPTPPETWQDDVQEIRRAADQAAGLTRQLLAFSRKQIFKVQMLDLNDVVHTVEKILRRLIGENIEMRLALGSGLGAVQADPSQVQQVIMNLVVNARDAITSPSGGSITIETADVELDEAHTSRHASMTPGSYVMLTVSDSGHGMDAETQARIFEPFFTTKGPLRGTGLGLSTVYGIVKQSGGHIWVYSEPGRGTTFKVYLPRASGKATPTGAPAAVAGSLRGTETILVAEDAEAVRGLARRSLTAHGYRVLEATNGPEALRHVKTHEGPIHLLLTDIVMPDMGGHDLAKQAAADRKGMRILYMSGYTENTIVHRGILTPGVAYLPKPFTPAALLQKVREVLDAKL